MFLKRGNSPARPSCGSDLNLRIAILKMFAMITASPLIELRAVEPMMKNGYVLACPRTREAAYIDLIGSTILMI